VRIAKRSDAIVNTSTDDQCGEKQIFKCNIYRVGLGKTPPRIRRQHPCSLGCWTYTVTYLSRDRLL